MGTASAYGRGHYKLARSTYNPQLPLLASATLDNLNNVLSLSSESGLALNLREGTIVLQTGAHINQKDTERYPVSTPALTAAVAE